MPPTPTPDELTAALQALPAWTVRRDALARDVTTPTGTAALLRAVEQLAEQLHHRRAAPSSTATPSASG